MTAVPKRWTADGPAKGETWVSWVDRAPPKIHSRTPEALTRIRAGYAALDERLTAGPIDFVQTRCGVINSGRLYRTRSGRVSAPAPKIAHREMRGLRRCRSAVEAWLIEEAKAEVAATHHPESAWHWLIEGMQAGKLTVVEEDMLYQALGLLQAAEEGP